MDRRDLGPNLRCLEGQGQDWAKRSYLINIVEELLAPGIRYPRSESAHEALCFDCLGSQSVRLARGWDAAESPVIGS